MIRNSAHRLARSFLLDILAVWLGLLIASWLRANLPVGKALQASYNEAWPALYILAPAAWIIGLYWARVYAPARNLTLQLEIVNLAVGNFAAGLLFCGILYIGFRDYSRLQLGYLLVATFILLAAHRIADDFLTRRVHAASREVSRVVVVGTDETALRFGEVITKQRHGRLELIGYVAETTDPPPPLPLNGAMLGSIDGLPRIIEQFNVGEIVVSVKWFDQAASQLIEQILQQVDAFPVNVRLAPDYSDVAYFHMSAETFYGMPLIGIREPVFTPYERLFKRGFDLVMSAVALVVCLPLFALIAAAIRLDSRGPVLLWQERAGYRGRPFLMVKFRTMVTEPASEAAPLRPYNLVKVRDDPRITRVGRLLRRTSLDELPQFYNVLVGDMSLVGPRPEIPAMVSQYEWWQRKRFEVPQGMTGWWQINGRADHPMRYYTSDDLFYIRNYSIWLDLWIIFRTIFAVVFGRGAY